MGIIKEGMAWPPFTNILSMKMAEHSAWYSGDAEVLANFYHEYMDKNIFNTPYVARDESFWSRQISNHGEIMVHVPIAGDIAETSANFLFGESPLIRISEVMDKNTSQSYKDTQNELDKMLLQNDFYNRILQAAETCSAMGGAYIKIAWDSDLSEYPIPVVVQADRAIPEFKFGILTSVTFWKTVEFNEKSNKVYRHIERYEKGAIINELYLGTADRLGRKVDLKDHESTEDFEELINTPDSLLAVYIPNMLPNRLDRSSYLGRSDYSGIEGLMDSLDEVYSLWVREIVLAQGRVFIPESFLDKSSGKSKFNVDRMMYVKLDVDPLVDAGITPAQFEIRADEFEKTALNFLERIITSAGYSPQSFGLNIQGRAESGTALSIRERKSFATKNKKEKYWESAVKKIVHDMMLVYNEEMNGKLDTDININVSFSDGITNDLSELSNSIKLISDAQAASVETKVRLLHTEWDEEQIKEEVQKIIDENGLAKMDNPDEQFDTELLEYQKSKAIIDNEE